MFENFLSVWCRTLEIFLFFVDISDVNFQSSKSAKVFNRDQRSIAVQEITWFQSIGQKLNICEYLWIFVNICE